MRRDFVGNRCRVAHRLLATAILGTAQPLLAQESGAESAEAEPPQKGSATEDVIVIEAARDRSETIDGTVYRIADTPEAATLSGLEVLSRVPQITVDRGGFVRLLGLGGVAILVDGKELSDPMEFLRGLRASQIEAIEVVTNPSARFSASYRAGVINVILKRPRQSPANWTITPAVEADGGILVSSTISTGTDRTSFSSGINAARGIGKEDVDQTCESLDSMTVCPFAKRRYRLGNSFTSASANANVDHLVAGDIRISGQAFFSLNETRHEQFIADMGRIDLVEKGNSDSATHDGNLSLLIGKREEEFIEIRTGLSGSNSSSSTRFIDGAFAIDLLLARTSEDRRFLAVDSRTELGDRVAVRGGVDWWTSDRRLKQIAMLPTGRTIMTAGETFEGNADHLAAYSDVTLDLDDVTVLAGLRAERRAYTVRAPSANARTYSDLFPSAHVEWKPSAGTSYKLSYSRRVAWPSLNDLNPISRPQTFGIAVRGNIDLMPQITDSAELAIKGKSNATFYGLIASYKLTDGIFSILPRADGTNFFYDAANAGRVRSLNAYVYVRGTFAKGLAFNFSALVGRQRFHSSLDDACCGVSETNWMVNGDITYREAGAGQPGGDQIRLAADYTASSRTAYLLRGSGSTASVTWTHWWTPKISSVLDISSVSFFDSADTVLYSDQILVAQRTRLNRPQIRLSAVFNLGAN